MIAAADRLRKAGFAVAILSDQTDWLDRLDRRDHFFAAFDRIFNSYHLGIGKRDPAIFRRVTNAMDTDPQAALFIDDNADNVRRAEQQGLSGHLFRDVDSCLDLLHGFLEKAGKLP
jgi:putative hydrolase of the HAD superfamily